MEKNLHQEIINEISQHKDFGKKNPIDIGCQLGYSQEDVLKALNMPNMEMKEEKRKQEYLVLKEGYVVGFDIDRRKASIVKKLDEKMEIKIKNGNLIWTNPKDRLKKVMNLYWENLENGDKGEFPLEKLGQEVSIREFYILSDGVFLQDGTEIYKIDFEGRIYKLELDFWGFLGVQAIAENSKKIYFANMFGIWSVNKDLSELEKICEYSAGSNKMVSMLEIDKDNVYCHIFKTGWDNYYYKYDITEGNMQKVNEYPYLSGKKNTSSQIGFITSPIELVTTENYVLQKTVIYSKNSKSAVWGKDHSLTFVNNAVGVYSEDIILGAATQVGSNSGIGIMMFDLKKNSAPIFFPIEE